MVFNVDITTSFLQCLYSANNCNEVGYFRFFFGASFFLLASYNWTYIPSVQFIDISDSPDKSPSFRHTCEVKNKIVNLNCVNIGSYNTNTYKKQ